MSKPSSTLPRKAVTPSQGHAPFGLRILIVRVGAMGDVIHALPAVAMLRVALPEAHIGWAIEPRWAPLLRAEGATLRDAERMPLVDAVHVVEAKQWNRRPLSLATARSIAMLRSDLRAAQYDLAIDLQGTLRSAVIARMSGAADVVGSSDPRERIARHLYRTCVPRTAMHVVDQAKELVRAASQDRGIAWPASLLPTQAPLLPRDPAADAAWQRRRDAVCGNRPPVLLAATAGWGAKEWPAANFGDLAAALVDAGHCVLLNTAPHETDAVTLEVLRAMRDKHPGQAKHVFTLPATLPELMAAMRDVHAVVAGDTGPLHLAEALGRPAVGLFGPTDPTRTGPRRNSINLRDARSVTDHRRHPATEPGLAQIPVEAVLAAVGRVVRAAQTHRTDAQ